MVWEVEFTDEFGEWWDSLSEEEQAAIGALVEQHGPHLRRPTVAEIRAPSTTRR